MEMDGEIKNATVNTKSKRRSGGKACIALSKYTSNDHGLVKCVRSLVNQHFTLKSHGIQTEASQPAGLHLASEIQSSSRKLRRVVRKSKMVPKS